LNIRPHPLMQIVKEDFCKEFHSCYQSGILHAFIKVFLSVLIKHDKTYQKCCPGSYKTPADSFGNASGRTVFDAKLATIIFGLVHL